ncbi:MAG: WD40/YVTN/BNR-like repeat-containing protein, partial [Actinomycetota bacterium]
TLDPKSGKMFRSGHPVTGGSLGVESSPDGGAWQKVSNVLEPPVDFHAMTVSQADAATIYGWDSHSSKTLRSVDGGRSWQELSLKGIGSAVFSFAAPATEGVILAGTPSGLFRSTDQGTSWTRISSIGDGYAVSVAADPSDANHFLSFTERGMKVTRDGGATWTPSLGGIPPTVAVTSLAISPVDGQVAYAADALTIFKTIDGGKTWTVVRSES